MKELKLFVCEICGTQYNEKKKCQECETSHKKPKNIVHARYVPYRNNKSGYPNKIEVEFSYGEVLSYCR